MRHLGNSQVRCPRSSCAALLMESLMQSVGSTSLWHILLQALVAVFPTVYQSCVMHSWRSTLNGVREQKSFRQYPTQLRKLGTHSHPVMFSHGHLWALTKLCCLGGWVTGKDKLFLTLSNDSSLRFFCSNNELKLLHWITVLQNNLLTTGNYISQCSPGALRLQPEGARAGSWATSGSTAWTKVSTPIIQCMGGQNFSWVPWHMMQNPTALKKALLSMDGC